MNKNAIAKITDRFPSAYLSIVVLPSEEIIKRLHAGDLDVGFGIFWEKSERLRFSAFTNNVGVAIKLLKTGRYIVPLPDNTAAVQTNEFRQIKISKGPRVIPEEFVYNPAVRGNTMKSFVVDLIEKEVVKK